MLYEALFAAGFIAFLAIIHVTDSAEEVITPFSDAAIRIWQFGIDVVASRMRFYGSLVIEAVGNGLTVLLVIIAGLVWNSLVWLKQETLYVTQTYGPIAKDKAVEYGNRGLRWVEKTLQILGEEFWKLVVVGKDRTQKAIKRALK